MALLLRSSIMPLNLNSFEPDDESVQTFREN